MQVNETILVIVIVHLLAFVFGYGVLYQKVQQINGEVSWNRRWRDWADNKFTLILSKLGLPADRPNSK